MRIGKTVTALLLTNVFLTGVVIWQAFLLRERSKEIESLNSQDSLVVATSSSSPFSPENSFIAEQDENSPKEAQTSHDPVARGSSWTESKVNTDLPAFDWQDVESEDYRSYVHNLRKIGVPEQTVRDIVMADVMETFNAKRAEVVSERFENFAYWKADDDEANARAILEQHRREVDEWMNATIHELLGDDVMIPPTTDEWYQTALAEQLTFLPLQTREQVVNLLLNYSSTDRQIKELVDHPRNMENPEERFHLIEAYDLKRQELYKLLTPEEYELVDMTASWTAENLRRAMTNFQPTEEEFRVIFREWRAHDENLAILFANGEADPGNAQVFANIAESLSPERYAQYRETWWK